MGHAIQYLTFGLNESKAHIGERCSDWYNRNKDWEESPGCDDVSRRIEYIDRTFDSEDEAIAYIDMNDRSYRLWGVKFRDCSKYKPSAKLNSLNEKIKEAENKFREISGTDYMGTLSSEFITCKGCGSKIARKAHINMNTWRSVKCPVCNADFRPKTLLDKIEKARQRIKDLEAQRDAEIKVCMAKIRDKAEIKWVIKLECHC